MKIVSRPYSSCQVYAYTSPMYNHLKQFKVISCWAKNVYTVDILTCIYAGHFYMDFQFWFSSRVLNSIFSIFNMQKRPCILNVWIQDNCFLNYLNCSLTWEVFRSLYLRHHYTQWTTLCIVMVRVPKIQNCRGLMHQGMQTKFYLPSLIQTFLICFISK